MIDYLEQLLEEQLLQQTGENPAQLVLVQEMPPEYRRMEEANIDRAAENSESASVETLLGLTHSGTGAGSAAFTWAERLKGDAWMDSNRVQAGQLRQDSSPDITRDGSAEGNAARLYQQMGRTAARVGYNRPVAQPVSMALPSQQAGQIVAPEGLDRLFQRDARRYDGGFTLY